MKNTRCKRGHERTPDNLWRGRCKTCSSDQARAWAKAHPEERRAVTAAWTKAHPEHRAYEKAKERCNNPNNKAYKNYGGRGIEFRFKSTAEFDAELGPRPKGKSLDRINNDGHYEKGNVRWASKKEQQNNRRCVKKTELAYHTHLFGDGLHAAEVYSNETSQ